MKRCFTCHRLKPLVWFKINNRKYHIKSDKGRAVNCRLCNVKRLIKQNGEVLKYNYVTNKYDAVTIKTNLINIIKYYFI